MDIEHASSMTLECQIDRLEMLERKIPILKLDGQFQKAATFLIVIPAGLSAEVLEKTSIWINRRIHAEEGKHL